MADKDGRLDLIQRLAEKQASDDTQSLAERAAERQTSSTIDAARSNAPEPSGNESNSAATVEPKRSTATNAAKDSVGQKNRFIKLDMESLDRAGYITPGAQQSHIAEEFRTIKRPLLLNAFSSGAKKVERGNVILVTSAKPGEGKTFVSLNLALSIASERDLHVLIIDTDVYRRHLQQELGLEDGKGLVDLLVEDDLNLPDLLIRTDIPNLTVLPVGNRNPQAPELLSSQKMAALMADIAARYPDRVIIIDSPPVLASSEASVMAMLVGQIVLVVEANKTNLDHLDQSLKLLNTCEHINFVINKSGVDSGSSPYGTYAYYDEYRKNK